MAYEHNYVMQETVGQTKPQLKPLGPKLNPPAPTKPQAHQMAAKDLQAVTQLLHSVVSTQKGQEAVSLPDLTWSDRRPFKCVCSLPPCEPKLNTGMCGVSGVSAPCSSWPLARGWPWEKPPQQTSSTDIFAGQASSFRLCGHWSPWALTPDFQAKTSHDVHS